MSLSIVVCLFLSFWLRLAVGGNVTVIQCNSVGLWKGKVIGANVRGCIAIAGQCDRGQSGGGPTLGSIAWGIMWTTSARIRTTREDVVSCMARSDEL